MKILLPVDGSDYTKRMLGYVAALVANAGLWGPRGITIGPTRRDLVVAAHDGVSRHGHRALRRQRRANPEVDGRDARDDPKALPRAAAAGNRATGAGAIHTGDV